MLRPIRSINTTADNVAPFVARMTGQDIGFNYVPTEYKIKLTVNRTTTEIPFPFIRETYSLSVGKGHGHLAMSKGGTKRFIRPILKCKKAHPFLQYYAETPFHAMAPAKDYTGLLLNRDEDEFYLCNVWMHVAELLIQTILNAPNEGRSIGLSFRRKFNEWFNKEELIQNEWGAIVMGQELRIGVPELSSCSTAFTQEAHSALTEAFQLRAYQGGYSLAATNKSDPGRVLTRRTDETVCHRTLLSRLLLPVSAQRLCRAPREQRGIREAKKLAYPKRPMVHLDGHRLPDSLAAYLTELPTLIADFPHTVPGTHEGEWAPTCSMNKDRVLLTPLGRKALITRNNVTKTLSEEQYASMKKHLEHKEDYELISDEFVEDGSGCVRNVTVRYSDTEKVVSHAKVICPTGLKGITEPIRTRFFASHKPGIYCSMLDEDISPLNALLEQGVLVEVAAIISASGVHSKRSDAIVPQMILSRFANEDGVERIVPDLKPEAWFSPSRSTSVDTIGNCTHIGNDFVDEIKKELGSRGQNLDGTMYVYMLQGDQLIALKDKDGGDFAGIVGYLPWWRTRHRDLIGSDVRTFGPNEAKAKRRGVAVDSHVANLAGITWPMNPEAEQRIALLAEGQYLSGSEIGFPTFSSSEASQDDYYLDEE